MQHGIDRHRVGIQVKHCPHAPNHQRQHVAQRIADLKHHMAVGSVKIQHQPARMRLAAGLNAQCFSQALGVPGSVVRGDKLNRREHAFAEEPEHGRHVVGRAKPQLYRAALACARHTRAPQLCGIEFVMPHKRRIEAPDAGKAADQRNPGDAHVGIGQQLLGRKQAAGLQVLQG